MAVGLGIFEDKDGVGGYVETVSSDEFGIAVYIRIVGNNRAGVEAKMQDAVREVAGECEITWRVKPEFNEHRAYPEDYERIFGAPPSYTGDARFYVKPEVQSL